MPAVDRAILRIGAWELLHNTEVPSAVAIAEAVEIAHELSTEASGAFVHGILANIAKTLGDS
jgi:N utilization substance protein B